MSYYKFNKYAKDLSENELIVIFNHIQENVGKYNIFNTQVYRTKSESYLGYNFYPKVEKFLIAYSHNCDNTQYVIRFSKDLESCRNQIMEEFQYEDFQFEVIPYPFKEI